MHSLNRCDWVGKDPLMIDYHDQEWGVPLHDDRKLFEFIVLDGFQAGLSWSCIIKKRENFRLAFDDFDPALISRYDEPKVNDLLLDPGIIRNRLKIQAAIRNARVYEDIQNEKGSFDAYIWSFVDGIPIRNCWQNSQEIPVSSSQSDAMSSDLKKRGMSFVGSTICYAFMQAAGLVNDHLVSCYRYAVLNELARQPKKRIS